MRGVLRNILLATLCLLTIEGIEAASPKASISYLELDSQLSNQAIFSIKKDGDGFLWLATRSVIARSDGRRMTKYMLNRSEITTDSDGLETYLTFSPDGGLWAFCDNGKIFQYDPLSDSFDLRLATSSIDSSLRLEEIYFLDDTTLWLATSEGLYQINLDNERTKQANHKPLIESLHLNSIVALSGNRYALNHAGGVLFIEFVDGAIVKSDSAFEGLNILSGYFDSARNHYWVGTFNSGLKCIDTTTGSELTGGFTSAVPLSPIRVFSPMEGNKLLIGLDGSGVFLLDKESLEARPYLSESKLPNRGLRGNGVYDIMVDQSRVWVATYTGGVTIINTPDFYEYVSHTPLNHQSLLDERVYAILEDRDGDMWYATRGGVSLYWVGSGRWQHFIDDGKTYLTLSEDTEGKIWCGGFNTGTHCIDKRLGVVRSIPSLDNSGSIDCIYASKIDAYGRLWLGGIYNSLTCITSPGDRSEKHDSYDIVGVNSIISISADSLLINTTNGFYILDSRLKRFSHYFNTPSKFGIETSSFIYTGISLGDQIWLGTSGGGLNLYDLGSNQVTNFSTYDGLPSNFIYAILKDERGNLWISSGDGIFCFDPIAREVLFNVAGLPVRSFIFTSAAQLRDGTLAFGGVGGAIMIDPKTYEPKDISTNIYFTELRVLGRSINAERDPEILTDFIDRVDRVELRHRENSFSIDFGVADLYFPADYIYSYRLEGFDEEWSPKGDYAKADYTNIPPGEHSFVVRCFNKNSPDNVIEKRVNIDIAQPFWNTTIAWIIYAILAIILAYFIWTYYQKRAENRRFDDKINLFINVAHDIRTPLSLLIAPLSDLEKEELTPEQRYYLNLATKNSGTLNEQVTRMLDFHKMESEGSKSEQRAVAVGRYLEQKLDEFITIADKKEIGIELVLPPDEVFAMVDFDRLNHIIENLISNAIKYTPDGGLIYIRLSIAGKRLLFEVEDNGIGIHKSEQRKIFSDFYRSRSAITSGETGSGIGLTLARRLARQMSGRLTLVSRENEGSTFSLSIPFTQAKEQAGKPETERGRIEIANVPQKEERRNLRERILLVEDNNDMRNYIAHTLSNEYTVHPVHSAEEALVFLRTGVADIVISDVLMSGMSGIDLCRKLKSSIETSHLFVILITAVTHSQAIREGFEAGADDYITKPLNVDILRMKISNMLQTRKKIQQQYLTSSLLKDSATPEPDAMPQVSSMDDDFLRKSIKIVTDNISNIDFTINELCRQIGMSRTLVYEKLRAMTGQSPSDFIRTIRVTRAKELLASGRYSVLDVAAMTGFSDSKYFSTVFKKYFGESPSKVLPHSEER